MAKLCRCCCVQGIGGWDEHRAEADRTERSVANFAVRRRPIFALQYASQHERFSVHQSGPFVNATTVQVARLL